MTANSIKSSKAFSVFIVSANNRIVPLETAIDHNDPVAERESYTAEKCLLYVALTRSQKQAYITCYGKKIRVYLIKVLDNKNCADITAIFIVKEG